jgi:hypothetical protein
VGAGDTVCLHGRLLLLCHGSRRLRSRGSHFFVIETNVATNSLSQEFRYGILARRHSGTDLAFVLNSGRQRYKGSGSPFAAAERKKVVVCRGNVIWSFPLPVGKWLKQSTF